MFLSLTSKSVSTAAAVFDREQKLPPPQNEIPELLEKRLAEEPYLMTRDAVALLWEKCRAADAGATPEEVLTVCIDKASRLHKVRNVVGLVLKSVPLVFAAGFPRSMRNHAPATARQSAASDLRGMVEWCNLVHEFPKGHSRPERERAAMFMKRYPEHFSGVSLSDDLVTPA